MKNYIRYIICSLSILCFSTLYAQEMPIHEQRMFRLGVYNAIESYEWDKSNESKFMNLFLSEDIEIYNDLLGLSTAPTLSVSDYVRILRDKAIAVNMAIRNVNIGPIYEDGGMWCIDVDFEKRMRYYNTNELLLSSEVYYGKYYNMRATFVLDSDKQPKITKLEGQIDSNREPLPENYFAVRRLKINSKKHGEIFEPRDTMVLCNGNRLDFIKDDNIVYALVPTTVEKAKFVYSRDNDIRIKLLPDKKEKGMYNLRYKPTHWRLKLRSDFTLGDYYNFEIEHKDDIVTKSSSNEFALELGYVFPSSKKLKVGLFFGAGIAMNKFELGFDSWDYSSLTNGSADVDGDKYTRHYSLKNFKQEYSTMDVIAPVYLDFEYRFSKWFSMYVDLGAKAYYNLEAEVGTLYGEYSTYGVYSQYDNLRLDYQSGINGFTENGVLGDGNIINNVLEPEEFTFDAFGSLGFRVGITKNLQLGCGATYQMGLTEYFTNAVNTIGMNNQQENVLVMYSAAQNKEIVRSIIDAASSVKRQTLKLNVGLTLKF